ncbi:MAG: hypothetical protein OQJ80_08825, partial [Kangiella sp.]|nr:hypothetical protein [Kangiella sp.]
GSTKGWINDAEREALVLLCESLETLGDRYAIYGFSGMTRKRCEVYRVKRFDDAYTVEVRGRISGIRPRDYTRMGVTIRHLCHLLNEVDARTRLLITLSDGKPDDYDTYRGAYGIEDTRQALIEAKRSGIHTFCITIDTEAKIPYTSEAAVEFADNAMEAISYYAIQASTDLAEERGSYESFAGSLWSQGVLPIDSIEKLIEERGAEFIEVDTSSTMDWGTLRERVKTIGMRNSNVMAIAPTATISNISGVSQSIEPTYQNLYVKSNLSGEFTVVNPYMVKELKARKLWDSVMVNDLKYYEGSLQHIDRIPSEIKELFATAFEVEPKWLVEAASRRQKWIDQAQSLNLYMSEPSGKKLDMVYRMAWFRGLKTTYYLRSLGATSTEKSTISDGKLNAVSSGPAPVGSAAPAACALDDPDCEACQ